MGLIRLYRLAENGKALSLAEALRKKKEEQRAAQEEPGGYRAKIKAKKLKEPMQERPLAPGPDPQLEAAEAAWLAQKVAEDKKPLPPQTKPGKGRGHAAPALDDGDDESWLDRLKEAWDKFWQRVRDIFSGGSEKPTPTPDVIGTLATQYVPTAAAQLTQTAQAMATPTVTPTATPRPTSPPTPTATPDVLPRTDVGQKLQRMADQAGMTSIQTCAIILRAEASEAPSVDEKWFSGQDEDPARLYQEAAARWFWTWGKSQG